MKVVTLILATFIAFNSTEVKAQRYERIKNWAGNQIRRGVINSANGYVVDRVISNPLRRMYERQGYYVPNKPPGIPWRLGPAYYTLMRARTVYSY